MILDLGYYKELWPTAAALANLNSTHKVHTDIMFAGTKYHAYVENTYEHLNHEQFSFEHMTKLCIIMLPNPKFPRWHNNISAEADDIYTQVPWQVVQADVTSLGKDFHPNRIKVFQAYPTSNGPKLIWLRLVYDLDVDSASHTDIFLRPSYAGGWDDPVAVCHEKLAL